VESYDESTYTCKADDTFRLISQEYYHTDQYERALILFNRNHPLATNSVRQDPPVLQAGQPVYIPPARILERYYGAPALEPAQAAPASTPSARAITLPNATGFAPRANVPLVAAGPPVKLPSPEKMPLYRVREGGEMMREVASRTLGSGDRWTEILRLNPRFDPKDVIPAGSRIRLPRGAHVDPQDVP
jgi:hypothetical protein